MAESIRDIKRKKDEKEKVYFLTIKLEFRPYTAITGLQEFIDLGLQFYIIDVNTGSPITITPSSPSEKFSVEKEGAFFGLLNKQFNTLEKCITYASEVELRAVRIYEDKILHFYRDWKDRSPSK